MIIKQTPAFKRDMKKLSNKHYDMKKLKKVVSLIENQETELLISRFRDHALIGNWKGYRELHIEANWLLIYQINKKEIILTLTRTGSHDDLF